MPGDKLNLRDINDNNPFEISVTPTYVDINSGNHLIIRRPVQIGSIVDVEAAILAMSGGGSADNIYIGGSNIGHINDTDLTEYAPDVFTVNGNIDVTNGLDVSGAPITTSSGITNTSGVVNITGGSVKLNDNIPLEFGNDSDLKILHEGTNSKIINDTGNFIVDSTPVDKNIVMRLGTDTNTTAFEIRNNSDTKMFHVSGAGECTLNGNLYTKKQINTESSTSDVALTVSQLLGGVLIRNSNNNIIVDTLPSVANVIAAIPNAYVGLSFTLLISNDSGTYTLSNSNAGWTAAGHLRVDANNIFINGGNNVLLLFIITDIGNGTESGSFLIMSNAS